MELIPDKIEAVQLSKKEIKMNEAGASREEAYAALARGLKARKSIPLKDGSVIEEDDIPTQLKAAETIARMNGDIKPEVKVDKVENVISIGGDGGDLRKLLEMVSDVNEQIRQLRGSGKQTGEIADVDYTVRGGAA